MREKKQDLEFQLIKACMNGDINVIDQYVQAGNDVNEFLHTGWTMLLYAASSVKPNVILELLNLGADPNVHKDGLTPLMVVCSSGLGDAEHALECITLLIEMDAEPNATNKDRVTALMFACEYREPEVVSELLKHVKDIEARDCDGRTAVFYAVVGNKVENLKLLMKNNASISITDRRDLTVQEIATTKGYDSILELLSNEDCDIENYCITGKITSWVDAFPSIKKLDENIVDEGVSSILSGLGLEQYRSIFLGMELNNFLTLTDDDLIKLGMDIEFHRKEFLDGLLKFHKKKWTNKSIGVVNKSLPYTIYNGVASLGNIGRQLGVIGASFKFIKNNLLSLNENEITLSDVQKNDYIEELAATEKSLVSLKKDLNQMLHFAKKVEMTDHVDPPASYIDSEKKKSNWPIYAGVTLMFGFYLCKTNIIKQLWNKI
ncbi:ankyrin repeat, SAM and basic leucine zipper domain-containing protein 1-like [Aphidius gifuensis]|uniref:ankyrin repeat, SAM and basic leucine zipper domain-containing protein 1-like n=1 Tax=Aphidius gifuensis TaxID=684658 RepID=UPI001CDCE043|nr:ankyrin repeat, SAM and basic leucine zipper domain-containing protein 1-like [Aphidius gifuensis]